MPKTDKEITSAAVFRYLEFFRHCTQWREYGGWAILCEDGKWRSAGTSEFEKLLDNWARGRFGRHLHCGQSSEFKQIIQTLMIGRPRLSEWRHDSRPVKELREFHDFEATRSQRSRARYR